jgi:hypothetical protein
MASSLSLRLCPACFHTFDPRRLFSVLVVLLLQVLLVTGVATHDQTLKSGWKFMESIDTIFKFETACKLYL